LRDPEQPQGIGLLARDPDDLGGLGSGQVRIGAQQICSIRQSESERIGLFRRRDHRSPVFARAGRTPAGRV